VDPTGVDLYVGTENEIGTYFYELDQSTSPVFSNVKVLFQVNRPLSELQSNFNFVSS
jgi:hypothetical protein